jgi:hypothetical protein
MYLTSLHIYLSPINILLLPMISLFFCTVNHALHITLHSLILKYSPYRNVSKKQNSKNMFYHEEPGSQSVRRQARKLVKGQDFSLLQCPDRSWGPPSLLCNGYWRVLTPGVKRPWREADHSPQSSSEVKNTYLLTELSPS